MPYREIPLGAGWPGNLMEAVNRLDAWIERNGWAGYDPYDIRSTMFFLRLQGASAPLPLKILRRLVFTIEDRYPLLLRRLFRVRKRYNAKAMGLFARAYLNLYRRTGSERYKQKAIECLEWLEANTSKGYSGSCWGYPFHWQSKVFIPEGTPSSVVSSIAGDAFWTAHEVLGDAKYLERCNDICRFFIHDLHTSTQPDGSLCFSYTPLDEFQVHNSNLFVAEFLTRIGKRTGNREYIDLGIRAAEYALAEQNEDGSLYYWGRAQNAYAPNHIDHYHSGFEIRALHGMWKWTRDEAFRKATERYYAFYRKHLLTERDGLIAPKMNPGSFYPVNIHSCAEAILCNATLQDEFPEAREIVLHLCLWVISTMQTREGWFIYMIQQGHTGSRPISIPYMRWGQAWMILALSAALVEIPSE